MTDSSSTVPQVLTAGSVNVDVLPGADWNQNLSNLAVGDTADRSVQVTNTSSLDISKMTVSASVADTVGQFGGHLPEALTVNITATPAGGSAITVATGVRVNALVGGYVIAFPGGVLRAGTSTTLGFHYVVAGAPSAQTGSRVLGARDVTANPDNKYQGSSASITYTVDAVQRAATGVVYAPTAAPVVASFDSSSATVSFTPPSGNMAGTVYTISSVEDPTKKVSTTGTSATVSGLAAMTRYTFVVTAAPPSGGKASAPSPASAAITTPPPIYAAFPTSTSSKTLTLAADQTARYVSYTASISGSHTYAFATPPIGYTTVPSVSVSLYRVNADGSLTFQSNAPTSVTSNGQYLWSGFVAGQKYVFKETSASASNGYFNFMMWEN